MDNTNQVVEGGTLLNSIANIFFKGLNSLLDTAAEYEEELGVLKQINRVTITDQNGREYSLKIKLSPVRDKQGLYYVEAETNCPGLDISSIDKKTMKINNSNMKQFNAMIDKLLEEHNVKRKVPDTEESTELEEDQENPSEIDDVAKLGNQLLDEMKGYSKTSFAGPDNEPLNVEWELIDQDNADKLVIGLFVTHNGAELEGYEPKQISLFIRNKEGQLKSLDEIKADFIVQLTDYRDDMAAQVKEANSTTEIQGSKQQPTLAATFYRDKETGKIELTAIKASCDITSAMDIIDGLIDNDEFANSIEPDSEKSFEITDEGYDFNIEEVDSVDPEMDYLDIFEQVSALSCYIKAVQWALGSTTYFSDSILSAIPYPVNELLESAAFWVIKHTGEYPMITNGLECNCCTLDLTEFKNENNKICIDLIKEDLIDQINNLLDQFDVYYVNYEHEEQSTIDNFVNEIDRLLVYA